MEKRTKLGLGLLLTALILLLVPSALAALPARAAGAWYVAPGGSDTSDCLSPTTPCATINGAIGKATAGDTIYVAMGIYTTTGNAVVQISKSITLAGGWDTGFTAQPGFSTVDGEDAHRGLIVDSGAAVRVERFIVQESSGPGIYVGSAMLTLNSSAVRNNHDSGILVDYSQVNLNNVTVSGNSGRVGGGGIYMIGRGTEAVANLYNCTISGNWGGSIGGGGGINDYAATVYMKNTILAGNTTSGQGPDCTGLIFSQGYNLVGNTTGCGFGASTGDLLNLDPQLVSLVNSLGFYALQAGSPAINAGNPTGCMDSYDQPLTADQRGVARVGRCDMGAYEYTTPGPAAGIYPFSGTPQTAPVYQAFPAPLRSVVVDTVGSLVPGATVTFTAPQFGASGTFTDTGASTTSAVADGRGIATAATFRANGLAGVYAVTATVDGGTSPAAFRLTNLGKVALPIVMRDYCPDFFDDFSNPASGWEVTEDDFVRTEYLGGEYRVLTKRSGYLYLFRAPTCDRLNYAVEVDARWHIATGSSYGIIFGLHSDFSEYYLFDLNTYYQQYRLYRRDASGFHVLVPATYDPIINAGTNTNHLKVSHDGNGIKLELNGKIVIIWPHNPSDHVAGVGLVSSPYSNAPTSDARFDNFRVTNLWPSGLAADVRGSANGERGRLPFRSWRTPNEIGW